MIRQQPKNPRSMCSRKAIRLQYPYSLLSSQLLTRLPSVIPKKNVQTFLAALGHTILEEYNCGQEDIEYNVTLRGGQFAGIFKDRGPVKNMQECMHLCCNTKKCDVAMMHGSKCFNVHCVNDTTCETIPADDEDIDMQVAHMTTKGTRQLSKFLENANF